MFKEQYLFGNTFSYRMNLIFEEGIRKSFCMTKQRKTPSYSSTTDNDRKFKCYLRTRIYKLDDLLFD